VSVPAIIIAARLEEEGRKFLNSTLGAEQFVRGTDAVSAGINVFGADAERFPVTFRTQQEAIAFARGRSADIFGYPLGGAAQWAIADSNATMLVSGTRTRGGIAASGLVNSTPMQYAYSGSQIIGDLVPLSGVSVSTSLQANVTLTWHGRLSARSRCKTVLDARHSRLTEEQAVALERQIEALLADEDELDEQGVTVSVASFDGLIEFLAFHKVTRHPNLSLTRKGQFAASWSPDRHAKLTLVFNGHDMGDWVAVDFRQQSAVQRGSGSFYVTVGETLPQSFMSWMHA
jgi:hypothetical protein